VLSLTYNKSSPIIFNTYQAYLKGSFQRLAEDMERARREKYVFAAKLVSGIVMCFAPMIVCSLGVGRSTYVHPSW
jgi:proline dehydrogenase